MMPVKVIGLTGTIAAGKDLVKQILMQNLNCYQVTLSGAIFGQLEKNKGTFTRKTMQEMGNELRQKYGGHVLAKVSTEFMSRDRPYLIVDGIRNPAEAEWLKQNYKGNFVLIGVDAPQNARFERSMKRGKPTDPKTFEEFAAQDNADQGANEPPHGQQVRKCLQMADFVIETDGDIAKVAEKVAEILPKIQ